MIKMQPNFFTEYVYVAGRPIAEKSGDPNAVWTDYVYADGKKIARIEPTMMRVEIRGTNNGLDLDALPAADIVTTARGSRFRQQPHWPGVHPANSRSWMFGPELLTTSRAQDSGPTIVTTLSATV